MTMGGPAYHHVKKAPAIISNHRRNQSYHVRKALGLIGSPWGKLVLENTKLLLEVLELHSGHF